MNALLAGLNDYANLIMAFATLIYTAGTFLLWWTTRRTVKLAERQADQIQNNLKGQIIGELIRDHRSLYGLILVNRELLGRVAKEAGETEDVFARKTLATMMINQASAIHVQYRYSNLDSALWNVMRDDIKDLFGWPFVRETWEKVKAYHSREFQDLVDSIIVIA